MLWEIVRQGALLSFAGAGMMLLLPEGAGRRVLALALGAAVLYASVVLLNKKLGDRVEIGECLAVIHASELEKAQQESEILRACFAISDTPVQRPAFIKDIVR